LAGAAWAWFQGRDGPHANGAPGIARRAFGDSVVTCAVTIPENFRHEKAAGFGECF
jgi:hypothetical protein